MDGDQQITTGPRGIWRWWPLRFLVLFILLLAMYAGSQMSVYVLAPKLTFIPPAAATLGVAAVCALLLIAGYRLFVRWLEHRPVTELSAPRAVPHLIGGALIGFILFASVYAVLWACGTVKFNGWNAADGLAMAAAMSILSGVGEELIFRGVVYRLFEEGFGSLIALMLSGAFFGLVHAANHGATLESSAAIALEAGILLGAAYLLTRSLWLAIGLHFGWNFTEGGIFGAAVSGGKSHGLLNATLTGPQLLTSGAFGPEASIAAVGVCLIAAVVLLVIAIARGNWKPLTFRFRSR